jgi:membrane protease YdiL (CAAX protease family)
MTEIEERPYLCSKGYRRMEEQFQEPPKEISSSGVPLSNSRPSMIGIALCWFLILGTIVFSQMPQYKVIKASPSDSATDLNTELTAKYLVGANQFLRQQPDSKIRFEQILQMLKNPSDRKQIAMAPVLAELSGKEAALRELQRLQAKGINVSANQDLLSFVQLYRDGEISLNPQQLQSIKKYGWIGRLALSQDKSNADPAHREILQSAFRVVMVLGILIFAILALVFAGVILLVVAIVFWFQGKLRSHLQVFDSPGIPLFESFTIYLTGFMVLPELLFLLFPGSRIGPFLLALLAVIIAIFWPRFRGMDWTNYRAALGWSRGKGFLREMGSGILGYVAGLPLLAVAVVLVVFASRFTGEIPSHPLFTQTNQSTWYLLVMGLLACVWAPIVEETFFRGMLFGYFRRHVSWVASGIFSALIFAMIHPQGWLGVPVIGTIGFILSAIREWRGSLIASISAHALNNASVLVLFILVIN